MNMFGFIQFNREVIADEIASRSGRTVKLGRMNWQADSYHIYGSYFDEFFNGFIKLLFDREHFEDRTWTSEFARPIFDDAKPLIRKKIAEQDKKY